MPFLETVQPMIDEIQYRHNSLNSFTTKAHVQLSGLRDRLSSSAQQNTDLSKLSNVIAQIASQVDKNLEEIEDLQTIIESSKNTAADPNSSLADESVPEALEYLTSLYKDGQIIHEGIQGLREMIKSIYAIISRRSRGGTQAAVPQINAAYSHEKVTITPTPAIKRVYFSHTAREPEAPRSYYLQGEVAYNKQLIEQLQYEIRYLKVDLQSERQANQNYLDQINELSAQVENSMNQSGITQLYYENYQLRYYLKQVGSVIEEQINEFELTKQKIMEYEEYLRYKDQLISLQREYMDKLSKELLAYNQTSARQQYTAKQPSETPNPYIPTGEYEYQDLGEINYLLSRYQKYSRKQYKAIPEKRHHSTELEDPSDGYIICQTPNVNMRRSYMRMQAVYPVETPNLGPHYPDYQYIMELREEKREMQNLINSLKEVLIKVTQTQVK